jgi:predicted TIM-barrel fold metal-dependent hydrolase
VTIIDAHVHVGTWSHADFLGRGATLDQTLAVMAASGVSGCALMPTDRCDNAGLLAEAVAAAGRGVALWLFAWVRPVADRADPGGDDGRRDLDWVEAHRDQVRGLKIHPSLSRVRVTDGGFAPALELAEARGLVVIVHCGRWQEMASFRFAIEAARRHPRARFLLAHAGGDTPPLATAAADLVRAERVDNVWFDFSGLREHWVVERNVELIGAERYLMGSDFNLAHPLMYIGAVRGMRIDDRQRALILGENARALFGEPLR